MNKLIIMTSKFSFLLLFLMSFPIIIEIHFILDLWLKEVPKFAFEFCQLSLIMGLLIAMFTVLTQAIFATGKIRNFSIISSLTYVLVLPISYVLFKFGYPVFTPFIINIILLLVGYSNNLRIAKINVPQFSIRMFLSQAVFVSLLTIVVASVVPLSIHFFLPEGFQRFFWVVIISVISTAFSGYFIAIDKEVRMNVVSGIKSKVKNKINI